MSRHTATIFLLACATCVGCSGPSYDSTVQGTVTVDGELAHRGRVVFHPVNDGPPAYGNIFENGTYSLRVGQGDLKDVDGGQVISGDYVVTVVVNMPSHSDETVGAGGAPTPGARITAAKYADKETSDLRATVKPGSNVIPLEVEAAVEEEVIEPAAEGAAPAEGTDPSTDSSAKPPTTEEAAPPESAPAESAPAETAAPAGEATS